MTAPDAPDLANAQDSPRSTIAVNLCLFNNPLAGVTDQVFFVRSILRDHGYEVSITDRLRVGALNLLIENFRPASEGCAYRVTIESFCRRFGKRVGIIMTEHIERRGTDIVFNGAPLTDPGYIGNKASRFFGLVAQSETVFGFFTLGALPELHSFRDIFLQHTLYRLPFPALDTPALPDGGALGNPSRPRSRTVRRSVRDYDCVFTGAMTAHRREVLADLRRRFRVLTSAQVDEAERAALYRRAKVALNIPQDPSWPWISPMRVMFGLRTGRPTVHIGGALRRGEFDRHVPLDEEIARALDDPAGLLQRQVEGYDRLVRETDRLFPDHVFRLWARLEGLKASPPNARTLTPVTDPY